MGMDAGADLVFGVDCGVEEGPWTDEEFAEDIEDMGDLEEGLLKQAGLVSPHDTIPQEIREGSYDEYRKWCDSNEEFKAANEKFRAEANTIMDACPFEIVSYGSMEWASYIVFVKGFQISGDWDSPRKVDPERFGMPDEATLQRCAEYAKEHGIKWGEPAWLISASWG